jgi:D-inositol-3-phosphate glycosyltransferase
MTSIHRSGPALGSLDPLAVGEAAAIIKGWAMGAASEVSRVEILLDGRLLGRAGLHRPRPDIAAVLKDEAAELSGFEFRLELRRIGASSDDPRLIARVTLLNGECADLRPVPLADCPSAMFSAAEPARAGSTAHLTRRGIGGSKIRLLCVARSLDLGGSQLRLREFVRHLRAEGRFDVTVISPTEGPLRQDLEAAGALVLIDPIPIDDVSTYERKLTSVAAWAAGRFDVVMAATLTSFAAIELAERLGLPSVWRIGEAEPLHTVVEWLGGNIAPAVEARAYRAFNTASAVLFNSKAALDIHRRNGANGNFAVFGTGTDVAGAQAYAASTARDAIRQRLGIAAGRRLLICAGTLWPIKGQATLVSALRHVAANHPHLECVLIGLHAEPYARAVTQLIERSRLSGSVRLLPFCDDLRPWWRAADVAVCASESESMPASVLEAMSFGLPVLACGVGGVPEIVKDGSTGWLCEAVDLASLIEGLERVGKAKPGELQALGENAVWFVHKNHDRKTALARATLLIEALSRGTYPRWLSNALTAAQDGGAGITRWRNPLRMLRNLIGAEFT